MVASYAAMKLLAVTVFWIAPLVAQNPRVTPYAVERIDYMLQRNDHILIRQAQIESLDGHIFQIQSDGFVVLPSVGRVRAAGSTLTSFTKQLARRLNQPQLVINVVACRDCKAAEKIAP